MGIKLEIKLLAGKKTERGEEGWTDHVPKLDVSGSVSLPEGLGLREKGKVEVESRTSWT